MQLFYQYQESEHCEKLQRESEKHNLWKFFFKKKFLIAIQNITIMSVQCVTKKMETRTL